MTGHFSCQWCVGFWRFFQTWYKILNGLPAQLLLPLTWTIAKMPRPLTSLLRLRSARHLAKWQPSFFSFSNFSMCTFILAPCFSSCLSFPIHKHPELPARGIFPFSCLQYPEAFSSISHLFHVNWFEWRLKWCFVYIEKMKAVESQICASV